MIIKDYFWFGRDWIIKEGIINPIWLTEDDLNLSDLKYIKRKKITIKLTIEKQKIQKRKNYKKYYDANSETILLKRKTKEHREYMKEYMQKRRAKELNERLEKARLNIN